MDPWRRCCETNEKNGVLELWNDGVMVRKPPLQYSITPLLQTSSGLLLPLQKFQPDPFGSFKKTNPPTVGQHALFENLQTGGFNLGDFAIEIVGVDGNVLQPVKLTQFLLREKFCHVKLHAVQIESVVFAAIGPGVLLENLRAGVFDIKIGGLFWIRRFQMKMIDSECHGILLFGSCRFLLPSTIILQSPFHGSRISCKLSALTNTL